MKRTKRFLIALLVFSLLLSCFVGCAPSNAPSETEASSTEPMPIDPQNPPEQAPKKVLLVSIDGMRPDALLASAYADRLMQSSTYYTAASTVYPSFTLPCHMSMHHGVSPEAHGVFTNTYTPSESLADGIAETLAKSGKSSAFFYNWGPLGDIVDESALVKHEYIPGETMGWEASNTALAHACGEYLASNSPDFTFLYLGYLDEMGHTHGWLSEEYTAALDASLALVFDIVDTLSEDYTVIITTDHGGHDYSHGSDLPEDMTIPIFLMGDDFAKNTAKIGGSILDIAPTVLDLIGVSPAEAWEGRSLK